MYKMIDGLKNTVKNDKPLRAEQRYQRIEKLETMMTIANVSDAEKYRRILEAYQIELDYGTSLEFIREKFLLIMVRKFKQISFI